MDFKVRALEFLEIYAKTANKTEPQNQLQLIQGLLKAMTVAHSDKHTVLFERIKSVLALTSSSNKRQDQITSSDNECEMLLTEMLTMILRPKQDASLQKAYNDSFSVLTKHFWQKSKKNHKFLVFTYESLLQKFLEGRSTQSKEFF
jgi:hypothetical protein